MSTEHLRAKWPLLAAALIVGPVLYVASFGPACWISSRTECGERVLSIAWQPMLWLWMRTSSPGKVVEWNATLGTPDGSYTIKMKQGLFVISW